MAINLIMPSPCQQLLKMAMTELNLSARAYGRILKVSPINLKSAERIQSQDISETIQYQLLDRQLGIR